MTIKYSPSGGQATAAPWQWTLVKLLFREPRRWLRSDHLSGHSLLIESDGRTETATIVDSAQGGLGITMRSRLKVGAVVSFSGAGVKGRGRVIHVNSNGSGLIRAGLAIEEAAFTIDNANPQRHREETEPGDAGPERD